MAVFQCKRSGNRVSFSNEDDIRGLRCHEGYVEIVDNPVTINVRLNDTPSFLQPIVKQRGRVKKIH